MLNLRSVTSPPINKTVYPITVVAVMCVMFVIGIVKLSSAQTNEAIFHYGIDRSALPFVNNRDITLIIFVGDSTSINLYADSERTTPIPFTPLNNSNSNNDSNGSQEIMVTTMAEHIHLTLSGYSSLEGLGSVRKAPLKDNKPWAYSHSFDDNFNLEPQLQILERLGLPATVYMVGDWVKEVDRGDWEIDANRLIELVNQGWSVGNHTWTHEEGCSVYKSESERRASLDQTSDWLHQIIGQSNRPNYRITSFAVPCGDDDRVRDFNTLLNSMEANGETLIQFSEAGWNTPHVYLDVTDEFDFDRLIPRDGRLDGENAAGDIVRGQFDEISDYAGRTPGLALWYNTFSHGNLFGFNTEVFDETMTYLVNTYGVNGSNEAWIAPADAIYDYLLVRDKTVINVTAEIPGQTSTPTPQPTPISQPTQIPPEEVPFNTYLPYFLREIEIFE